MSIESTPRYVWHDMRFAWDPSEFGGIKVLRVDPSLVWFPDITLYNRLVARRDISLWTNGDNFNVVHSHAYHLVSTSIAYKKG